MAVDTFDITAIRKDFPILSRAVNGQPLIYLDNAASTQKPSVVIDRISQYYSLEHSNIHRGVHALSAAATTEYEKVRQQMAQYLNAQHAEEVIFTKGTTDAINLVASSYGRSKIQQGDQVIITTLEHHSNIVPWQLICEQAGAQLKVVPIDDHGDIDLETFANLLSDKTKMVAVGHVSNALGTINPIEQIIELAHDKGVPVLLDGAQAAPHLRIDVQALDCDFYALSAHKLYGPTGLGVLYGKKKWLEALPPYQGGGDMIKTVTFEQTTYNDLPHKFEAGTPNIAGVIGLGAALTYLSALDWKAIEAHEQQLLDRATQAIENIHGVNIIGRAKQKASVVSYLVDGLHPYDVGTLLDQQGIAVRTGHHCAEPLMRRLGVGGTIRASFGLYNTLEEVDRWAEGTEKAINMLK